MIRAVLWDFGGVILSSPFEAFNRYEAANGLPADFIRSVNATNPDANAWALLERNDVTPEEFDALFADESEALGHRIPGADVLGLLSGENRREPLASANDDVDLARGERSLRCDDARDRRRPRTHLTKYAPYGLQVVHPDLGGRNAFSDGIACILVAYLASLRQDRVVVIFAGKKLQRQAHKLLAQ